MSGLANSLLSFLEVSVVNLRGTVHVLSCSKFCQGSKMRIFGFSVEMLNVPRFISDNSFLIMLLNKMVKLELLF